jgi:hypothetical protein
LGGFLWTLDTPDEAAWMLRCGHGVAVQHWPGSLVSRELISVGFLRSTGKGLAKRSRAYLIFSPARRACLRSRQHSSRRLSETFINQAVAVRRRAEFDKIIDAANQARPREERRGTTMQRLINLVHMGAFADEQVANALAPVYGYKWYEPWKCSRDHRQDRRRACGGCGARNTIVGRSSQKRRHQRSARRGGRSNAPGTPGAKRVGGNLR